MWKCILVAVSVVLLCGVSDGQDTKLKLTPPSKEDLKAWKLKKDPGVTYKDYDKEKDGGWSAGMVTSINGPDERYCYFTPDRSAFIIGPKNEWGLGTTILPGDTKKTNLSMEPNGRMIVSKNGKDYDCFLYKGYDDSFGVMYWAFTGDGFSVGPTKNYWVFYSYDGKNFTRQTSSALRY